MIVFFYLLRVLLFKKEFYRRTRRSQSSLIEFIRGIRAHRCYPWSGYIIRLKCYDFLKKQETAAQRYVARAERTDSQPSAVKFGRPATQF